MPTEDVNHKIAEQLERTNKLINRLENQRYLQMVDHPGRFLMMSFFQGLAVAIGSTIGLTVILTIIAYILRKLAVFAPLDNQVNAILHTLQNIGKK